MTSRELRHVRFVRHERDRDPVLPIQFREELHDFHASRAVETPGRFVRQKKAGTGHKGARNGDALLLSAREFRRRVTRPVGKSHALERLHGLLVPFGAGKTAVEKRQFDVFERRRSGEQIEALKDETEVIAAQHRELIPREPLHMYAVKEVLPGRRTVERPDDVHRRGLSRARRTHDRHEFAFVDAEVHALQGLESRGADAVPLVDVAKLNQGRLYVDIIHIRSVMLLRSGADRRRSCRLPGCLPTRFPFSSRR